MNLLRRGVGDGSVCHIVGIIDRLSVRVSIERKEMGAFTKRVPETEFERSFKIALKAMSL